MGVLVSDRKPSPLEYYHTATLARAEITRLVMNENVVPKRWRPVFTFPTIEKVIALIDAITATDALRPRNEDEFILKIKWQTRAILVVEQILEQLQYLIETLRPNVDKFQRSTEYLIKESSLLKEWRTNTEQLFENFKLKQK